MLENSRLVLLSRYLEKYCTEFHQTFSIDAVWDKDELFNVWSQKVRGQGHSMAKDPEDWIIQGSALCIEF